MEGVPQQSRTPEEEIAFLRAEVARKEAELIARSESVNRERIVHEQISTYRQTPVENVIHPVHAVPEAQIQEIALNLAPESDDSTMSELQGLMETKGIKAALSVLEKLNSPHLEDDFHRFLVAYVLAGMPVQGLSEDAPEWKALHMTLFEIALPESKEKEEQGEQ